MALRVRVDVKEPPKTANRAMNKFVLHGVSGQSGRRVHSLAILEADRAAEIAKMVILAMLDVKENTDSPRSATNKYALHGIRGQIGLLVRFRATREVDPAAEPV